MKIQKIKTIKGYKSFSDFSWAKFCKDTAGQEKVFGNFSVIFGENGSGKSSTCEILKSFTQLEDFPDSKPTMVEIEADSGTGNFSSIYENSAWTGPRLPVNATLFFDVNFINTNVHTHGDRSNQQGRHSQNAGKLIIDLDEYANKLKEAIKTKKEEITIFENSCSRVLDQAFTDKEEEYFTKYQSDNEETIKILLGKTEEELRLLEIDLKNLNKLNSQYGEISKIKLVDQTTLFSPLPSRETCIELFSRQIKEKAQDDADSKIKTHFQKHKSFILMVKDQIPNDYSHEDCPLCMQPLANASKTIEYYRAAFDQTYENEKRKFLVDIQTVKNQIEAFKYWVNQLPTKTSSTFDNLEKIKDDFEIPGLYKLEEKTKFMEKLTNISLPELDEFLQAIDSLKSIDRKEVKIEPMYEVIVSNASELSALLQALNETLVTKNEVIVSFKTKYSDKGNITSEIQDKTQKQIELKVLDEFLKSDKIKLIKEQKEIIAKQKILVDDFKKIQDELKDYLANTIPESVIVKMISILSKFNLSFTLEHIKPAANTRDYSFSFRIKDSKGNERELKDGLSEGERQLISIAFFFAINENLPDKNKKILIFDDPITSLDSPNLKILAELIHQKTSEFSQVLVFTHHPLFFKYLTKSESPNPSKFGILKNGDSFGGSFMFFDPGFDLIAEMQLCNQEIAQNAQNGTLRPEEIALKYGQLLRLSIEKFIKHELLMWDKEKNFEKDIIANLGQSKNKIQKLDDSDLEVMTNMYKYCNYSNLLHADKETPSALSELISHIDKFVKMIDKVRV